MTETLHIAHHELRTHVLEELSWSPDVRAEEVDAEVDAAVVTLSGQAASDSEKKHAVQVARQTEGVKEVVDNLAVDPSVAPPPAPAAPAESAPAAGAPSGAEGANPPAAGSASRRFTITTP